MTNKKLNTVLALAVAVVGLAVFSTDVSAKEHTTGWTVTYDGKKLTSGYDVSKDTITGVMPGDTITYNVSYANNGSKAADFYISTDIIDSLEDKSVDGGSSSAAGGAYSYELMYTAAGKTTTIYNSDIVGGDSATLEGLKQIKASLPTGEGTYISLGTLQPGKDGTVTMVITLDGNSQDSSYMATLATLDFYFGVEEVSATSSSTGGSSGTTTVVYTIPGGTQVVAIEDPTVPLDGGPVTGDSILPLVICTAGLLLGLLLILWYMLTVKKQRKEAC